MGRRIAGVAFAFGASLLVACSSSNGTSTPHEGGVDAFVGSRDASIRDARVGTEADAEAPVDAQADASHPVIDAGLGGDGADLVTYGGTRTISTSWGCAVAWLPTNVVTPIAVNGIDYPLTVIGAFCPPTGNLLDPLMGGTSLNLTTSVGIWALRFETPNETGDVQMSFLVYGGDTSAQAGARFSLARWPGEYHDDGRPNSADYCDFGGSNTALVSVVDGTHAGDAPCKLPKNTFYYFNAVVVALDPRGNSSVFGWADGF